uniref:Uncharacterized protein n=1 Tax=Siphoviridae sp. ctsAY3 TaxID=2827281 RepID=A0A8S5R2V7_9CAUD|nr:MAG TPA: hypothetical protein [Siphoviridae sp. ctsAY3]
MVGANLRQHFILLCGKTFCVLYRLGGKELHRGAHFSVRHRLHLPIPVKPQQQVHRIPNLLPGLHIICEEAPCGTIPAFVKVGGQHDNSLFCGGRHGIVRIMPGGDMLVTFRIGNGCPDISPEQLVVLVMGKDQVVLDFLEQFVHAATSLSIGSHKACRLQFGEQAVKIRNKGRHLCCHTISLIGRLGNGGNRGISGDIQVARAINLDGYSVPGAFCRRFDTAKHRSRGHRQAVCLPFGQAGDGSTLFDFECAADHPFIAALFCIVLSVVAHPSALLTQPSAAIPSRLRAGSAYHPRAGRQGSPPAR